MKLPSTVREAVDTLRTYFNRVELADRNDDLDMDPLTAAAWENVTKAGSGTINWNTVFGVPADAIGVFVRAGGADGAAGTTFLLQGKITTTNASFVVATQVANVAIYNHGLVPIASNGTSYYWFSAGWDTFYLRVVGWIKP